MSEQRTSPEQRRALRARYTPEPVPGCPHCGGKRALAWAFEPRLQMHLFRCATPECRERRPDTDTLASTGDPDVLAACDDADALAGARAECQRLRTALALVLDEMEGCEGRQGMWEDGIDPDYRRSIERGRAALKTGREGASE